ncbi:hypothetical protein CCO04_02170 [Pimelobacter sp. 30-1]|nr:hypothetical protein [Pimelobacter sp. 30-1]
MIGAIVANAHSGAASWSDAGSTVTRYDAVRKTCPTSSQRTGERSSGVAARSRRTITTITASDEESATAAATA